MEHPSMLFCVVSFPPFPKCVFVTRSLRSRGDWCMSSGFSRRQFLNTSVGALVGSAVLADRGFTSPPLFQQPETAASKTTVIRAMNRTLEVNGKAANVLGLLQPNGTQGMSCVVNELFNVRLDNALSVPTAIHWHGLHPPNNEDGVPGVTQPVIRAGASSFYNFPLQPAGTHWMHSHQGLQEAFLLAAPLIVHDPADRARDQQEIVVLLSDYSFTPPKEIYARLRQSPKGMSVATQGRRPQDAMSMKAAAGKP